MTDFNFLSLAIASIGAFILSSIWYMTLSGHLSKLHKAYAENSKMPAWKVIIELLRSLAVASMIAFVFNKLGVTNLGSSLLYGVAFWLAFPVVILAGSVVHEKVPVKLAYIHAGDWLIKLLFITTIITLWN